LMVAQQTVRVDREAAGRSENGRTRSGKSTQRSWRTSKRAGVLANREGRRGAGGSIDWQPHGCRRLNDTMNVPGRKRLGVPRFGGCSFDTRGMCMAQFNPVNAFNRICAESQQQMKANAELSQLKRDAWDAYRRRQAAVIQLGNLLSLGYEGGEVNIQAATGLMIEYAQTVPPRWAKTLVKEVTRRLKKMLADGRASTRDACLKEVLLNLLLRACLADAVNVAAIFQEVAKANPWDIESFRSCLINWLDDKVITGWPPLPDELTSTEDGATAEAAPDVTSGLAPKEEWISASAAVERAEYLGHSITLKWLTQDAPKHGVRLRPRQQAGRHKKEVEWTSLTPHLVKRTPRNIEQEDEGVRSRLLKAREQKRTERSLD
jgi:hypothetical protein